MTRNYIVPLSLAFGLVTACATPMAQITDDAVVAPAVEDQVRLLREEVDAFEGRAVLAVDGAALPRMRVWLEQMETASDEEAVVYEAAVRAQLEYLRTSEILHYADEAQSR